MTDFTPENKEFAKEWVAALKSGEYLQGTGELNKDGEFCCLGVACDLKVKKGIGEWENGRYVYGYMDASYCLIPGALRLQMQLGERFQELLMNLNDQELKTFPEIAEVIERYYGID